MAARKKKAVPVEQTDEQNGERTYTITKQGSLGLLTSVRSNIKGGVLAPLGSCTAVVSPSNRAGKTAVLDSIRFALTGEHPIGAHYADLCGLTADGSPPFAAVAKDTQELAVSQVASGKRSVTHDDALNLTDSQRAHLLPLSSVRDLLTLGTAKAREELFKRFGAGGEVEAPDELDDEQISLWNKALDASPALDPADRLAAAGEWIRKEKRRLSGELKSLEGEKERLLDIGDFNPTDQIADLQGKLAAAQAVEKYAGLLAKRAEVGAELSTLVDQFQAMPQPESEETFHQRPQKSARAQEVTRAHQSYLQAKTAYDSVATGIDVAKYVLTLRNAMDDGCIVCGQHKPANADALKVQGAAYVQAAEMRVVQQKTAMDDAHRAWQEAINREAAENTAETVEWRNKSRDFAAAQNRIENVARAYKALNETLEQAGAAGDVVDEATQREWMNELAELVKKQAARVRAGEVKRLMRETARAQEDAKVVEAAIADALSSLVEHVALRATSSVNLWMPTNFHASLRLQDAEGKPVCRWEVVGKDGQPHPRGAASGAEWAALTVALACAWTEGAPYRFLLLDDADLTGFSAENVRSMLTTVRQAVEAGRLTQAFVAWSRPDEIPDQGWTVVSL